MRDLSERVGAINRFLPQWLMIGYNPSKPKYRKLGGWFFDKGQWYLTVYRLTMVFGKYNEG